MPTTKQRYLTDEKGQRVGVVLDLDEYRKMLDQIEELDSIRAYDEAKASQEKPISLDLAMAEIESEDG